VQSFFLDRYDPTIEDSYRKEIEIDGQRCVLEILDTAGTEQFTAMRDLYIRNGEGFLLVYSITSLASLEEVKNLREQITCIKKDKKQVHSEAPVNNATKEIPIVLVGNKCDLEERRMVSKQVGKHLASQWACPFHESSARTNLNVDCLFIDLVKQIRKRPIPNQKKRRNCAIF
jgi:Ras-related protein Rap-1A